VGGGGARSRRARGAGGFARTGCMPWDRKEAGDLKAPLSPTICCCRPGHAAKASFGQRGRVPGAGGRWQAGWPALTGRQCCRCLCLPSSTGLMLFCRRCDAGRGSGRSRRGKPAAPGGAGRQGRQRWDAVPAACFQSTGCHPVGISIRASLACTAGLHRTRVIPLSNLLVLLLQARAAEQSGAALWPPSLTSSGSRDLHRRNQPPNTMRARQRRLQVTARRQQGPAARTGRPPPSSSGSSTPPARRWHPPRRPLPPGVVLPLFPQHHLHLHLMLSRPAPPLCLSLTCVPPLPPSAAASAAPVCTPACGPTLGSRRRASSWSWRRWRERKRRLPACAAAMPRRSSTCCSRHRRRWCTAASR
jgi:hypothetical protein